MSEKKSEPKSDRWDQWLDDYMSEQLSREPGNSTAEPVSVTVSNPDSGWYTGVRRHTPVKRRKTQPAAGSREITQDTAAEKTARSAPPAEKRTAPVTQPESSLLSEDELWEDPLLLPEDAPVEKTVDSASKEKKKTVRRKRTRTSTEFTGRFDTRKLVENLMGPEALETTQSAEGMRQRWRRATLLPVGGVMLTVTLLVFALTVGKLGVPAAGVLVGCLLLATAVILVLLYLTNEALITSITEPLAVITETAKRIAAGSYGVQIEEHYKGEIGELVDTINDMSVKVSQAEKMKSEFISSVSHELRTPLTAINGWGETLRQGKVDERDTRTGLKIIVSEAERLTKMVEELLEFSRIEDGRFTLRMERIDIKAELEDAVYTYREYFRKKGISLEYHDSEEEFPLISGDPERLRQVFSNLMDNAAKHGGSGRRITVSIYTEGAMVAIRVRDYGHGIPAEALPHVKTKFYKASQKTRGSGIGLAVCDEIAIRHNGSLSIENARGGGCVATLRLPLPEEK